MFYPDVILVISFFMSTRDLFSFSSVNRLTRQVLYPRIKRIQTFARQLGQDIHWTMQNYNTRLFIGNVIELHGWVNNGYLLDSNHITSFNQDVLQKTQEWRFGLQFEISDLLKSQTNFKRFVIWLIDTCRITSYKCGKKNVLL